MYKTLKPALKKMLGVKTLAAIRRIRFRLRQIRDLLVVRYQYTLLIIAKFFGKRKVLNGPGFRHKRHVLFVTEKWCDCNPAMGNSNSEHNLYGSLEASGLATQERFYFDEYHLQYKRQCDAALLKTCMETKPDIVFYSYFGGRYDPKWETFSIIRKKLGICVVVLWCEVYDLVETYLPYVELNIVLQSSYLKKTNHPEKYLLLWSPQDMRIYYNPHIERDIDISFIGSMHQDERQKGIAALKANGINVYQSGGQRINRLSTDEYARCYMRSKIALNFSRGTYWSGNPFLIHHAKGRIFETTLCGSMLLDSDNPETKIWFEPMVDYVPFADEADLVEKARYYIEHDAEREKIAASGHEKAKKMYTSALWWKSLFTRIFGANF